jgi:hypothetical protein
MNYTLAIKYTGKNKMVKPERKEKTAQSNMMLFRYFERRILKSKKINIGDTILLVGTPRSGSTYAMRIFSALPGYASMFEPENPNWCPESFEVGFRSRTYLSPNVDWPEGEDYLRRAFIGKTAKLSVNYGQLVNILLSKIEPKNIMYRLLANKLVVKSIGLNRLLPWIAKRFQLRGIYFIIRHPCAVVASQLKTGWCGYYLTAPPYTNIFPTRQQVLEEASEIEGLDQSLINRLKKIETQDEILAAVWCIDNYVPLSLPKPHPWSLVIYEKFVKERKEEITRLFNEIGVKNIPRSTFRKLNAPIMLKTSTGEIVEKADKQLSKWKESLSEKQIERILKIVSEFGLDFYTENIEQDYDNAWIRMKN